MIMYGRLIYFLFLGNFYCTQTLLSPFRGGTPAQVCVVVEVLYRLYRACLVYCRGGERGIFAKKRATH